MSGFSGLHVDQATGDRWELALDLLNSGEAAVSLAGVVISRDTQGPRATGRIAILLRSSTSPEFLTSTGAERDVMAALHVVNTAAAQDPRFGSLLAERGFDIEYVHADAMGDVRLANVSRDGGLTWLPGWESKGLPR